MLDNDAPGNVETKRVYNMLRRTWVLKSVHGLGYRQPIDSRRSRKQGGLLCDDIVYGLADNLYGVLKRDPRIPEPRQGLLNRISVSACLKVRGEIGDCLRNPALWRQLRWTHGRGRLISGGHQGRRRGTREDDQSELFSSAKGFEFVLKAVWRGEKNYGQPFVFPLRTRGLLHRAAGQRVGANNVKADNEAGLAMTKNYLRVPPIVTRWAEKIRALNRVELLGLQQQALNCVS